jgi:hypothetical protein
MSDTITNTIPDTGTTTTGTATSTTLTWITPGGDTLRLVLGPPPRLEVEDRRYGWAHATPAEYSRALFAKLAELAGLAEDSIDVGSNRCDELLEQSFIVEWGTSDPDDK